MPKVRYDEALKEQALAMMESEGVSATAKALNVHRETLYRWRNASNPQKETKAKAKAKPRTRKTNRTTAASDKKRVVAEANELLLENDQEASKKLVKLVEENNRLLAENAALTAENQKLKDMLRILIS